MPSDEKIGRVALPRIPVFHVGASYPLEIALAYGERGYELLAAATQGIPKAAVRIADSMSRIWLERVGHPHLAEIRELARRSREPGLFYFNSHYEWGCTCTVRPASNGAGMRLVRAFDWRTAGLGRHVIAARISGAAGPWVALTWPAYTGALHGMAPGRFSAALNEAPRRAPSGWSWPDWALARARVLRERGALTPAHLLRRVFETARGYEAAREMLIATPVCAPAIFTLAGIQGGEACVIERRERAANVIGPEQATCANDWQCPEWREPRSPGRLSGQRFERMRDTADAALDVGLGWATWPIRNAETRLLMVADAAAGQIVAQGFEEHGPATAVLELSV